MTAIRFATSIVLGLVATTSAFAAEPDNATVPAATAAAATTVPAAAPRNVRYCIRAEVTGSRIDRMMCDSRSNWQAKGVDVDAMLARQRR